jgi:hypothetical protein
MKMNAAKVRCFCAINGQIPVFKLNGLALLSFFELLSEDQSLPALAAARLLQDGVHPDCLLNSQLRATRV